MLDDEEFERVMALRETGTSDDLREQHLLGLDWPGAPWEVEKELRDAEQSGSKKVQNWILLLNFRASA